MFLRYILYIRFYYFLNFRNSRIMCLKFSSIYLRDLWNMEKYKMNLIFGKYVF